MKAAAPRGLFGAAPARPEGLQDRAGFLDVAGEAALAARVAEPPLRPFEFHGHAGNRRIYSIAPRTLREGARPQL